MIKDQILLQNYSNFLQKKCFSCSQKDHLLNHCPIVHYIPNKLKIIKAYNKDPGQMYRVFIRRKRGKNLKFNALNMAKYVIHSQKRFQHLTHLDSGGNEEESTPNEDNNYLDLKDSIENDEESKNLPINKLKIDTNFERIIASQTPLHRNLLRQHNISNVFEENEEKIKCEEDEEENDVVQNINPSNLGFLKKTKSYYGEDLNSSPSNELLDIENFDDDKKMNNGMQIPNTMNISQAFSLKKKCSFMENQNQISKKRFSYIENIPPKKKYSIISKRSYPENMNKLENKMELSMKRRKASSSIHNYNEKPINNSVIINKEIDENALFEADFEKGCNFKNYFPDQNPNTIIKNYKKCKSSLMSKKINYVAIHKKREWISNNKVVPMTFMESPDLKRKPQRRILSNIFKENFEKQSFFQNMGKISFYDIVNQVLVNQDLRKKLSKMKKKRNFEKEIH